MDQELLTECADWIAEQMGEEGFMVAAELVELILQKESATPAGKPAASHDETAGRLVAELLADGVQSAPNAIDERLVRMVLEWEDEFLALAGRPRDRGR